MPNEIKKFPYALSVDAEQSDNTRRKSISQSSTTALIWTISGIILVACGSGGGSGGGNRIVEDSAGDADPKITGTIGLANPTDPGALQGTYGELTYVAATKTWTYTLDNDAAQVLRAGEERTETFTFTDATADRTEVVTITVVGVNDAPVVATPIGMQTVGLDQPTVIDLSDLFSDIEGEELTLTVTGLPSGLSYSRETGITGTPDTEGEFTVTVVANDGSGGTATATFVIVVAENVVIEDSGEGGADPEINGTIGLADPTPPVELQGTYGVLTYVADTKTWTYTLDNDSAAVQALAAGQTETETFTFTDATAGSDATEVVTIIVVGVNDDPVVATPIGMQSVRLDRPTVIDLSDLFSDVDANDTLTLMVTGLPSGLSYSRETGITGTPDTVGTFTVTVMANDGNGGIVETTFDIVVSEGPVVNEDDGPVSGTISLADPTDPGVLQGTYGELTFDAATKTWTYTLDNASAAVQALAAGQEVTETFTFTDATDNSVTEDVEITVVGVNDAPEVDTPIERQSVRLEQPVTAIDLSGLFSDVDANDTLTLTVTLDDGAALSTIGLSYDSGTKMITGTPNTEGEFTVTVVANDGNGGTVESTFVVAVVGQIVINEDGSPVTGTISLADPTDPGTVQGTYGMLEFDADTNTWTYTLDNTSAAVQALGAGEERTETFTFTDATDGSTEEVEITVVGVNDAPEITAGSPAVSVPDGDTSFATNLNVVDVDDGDLAALTSGSFTLAAGTGATAAIMNKFEVVNLGQQWTLRLKSGESLFFADAAAFIINVSVRDAGGLTDNVDISFTVAPPRVLIDAGNSVIMGDAFEGDHLSTSGDLDVNSDVTLASDPSGPDPFTVPDSAQGDYGTASINADGEWEYTLDNDNPDVRALNSGGTLTDTFEVNVTADDGSTQTQTITITISGRTDVLGSNGPDGSLGDASTADHQAIFGFNAGDTLTGGTGDDLLVGGYGADMIDLGLGVRGTNTGADTVVYRINSSDGDGLVKAEDGGDTVIEFTPGEDKLVILDVNGTPTTLTDFFDALTKDAFQLGINGDDDSDGNLDSSELDAGARAFIAIVFQAGGTVDGEAASNAAGGTLTINFDRVTTEALNDMTVWDTLTGGNNFSANATSTVAMLSSLFGGFGRTGYDATLDTGDFISIIGPDDLPDSYFEIA